MDGHFLQAIIAATTFGVLGIILMLIGFKAFDWITPRIDVQKELSERNNIAVAIVVAAVLIAIALIVGKVVSA